MKKLIFIFFVAFLCLTAHALVLGWDTDSEDVSGYIVYCGIGSRLYSWSVDVGTNLQVTFTNLPGGFTYYFAVEAYDQTGTGRKRHRVFSGPSDEISWTSPVVDGEPQLLVTNHTWVLSCYSSTGGSVQTSSNLVIWSTLMPLPIAQTVFTNGPTDRAQFFRVKLR